MKTIILVLLALTGLAVAQTPVPSTPAPPFDALHIAPPAVSSATPTPLTVAQKQAQFHATYVQGLKVLFVQVKAGYTQLYKLVFTDESATGGLSVAQKIASLKPTENAESLTIGWTLANLINSIQPGAVPNPPGP